MKKIISLFIIVLLIFGFIACGEEGEGNGVKGTTLSRMPASMKSFGYINPKNMKKLNTIEEEWDNQIPAQYVDVLNMIDEVYFATEAIQQESISEGMGNIGKAAETMDIMLVLKGKYDQEEIVNTVGEEMNLKEEVSYDDIKGYRNPDSTLLFIDDTTMILCTPDFAQTAVNAYVKGENTVDTSDVAYKTATKMKPNAMWFVTNLDFMEKIDLGELGGALPFMNLEGETGFGITTLGLSTTTDSFTIDVSTELDDADLSKKLSEGLNETIKQFENLDLSQAFGLPPEMAEDLKNIMKTTRLKATDKKISTSITIKDETIKLLNEMFGGQMPGQF
jgi:hypothetical protein